MAATIVAVQVIGHAVVGDVEIQVPVKIVVERHDAQASPIGVGNPGFG